MKVRIDIVLPSTSDPQRKQIQATIGGVKFPEGCTVEAALSSPDDGNARSWRVSGTFLWEENDEKSEPRDSSLLPSGCVDAYLAVVGKLRAELKCTIFATPLQVSI